MKVIQLSVLMFLFVSSFLMAQNRQFTLRNTHIVEIKNELTNRNHELIIFLPGSYESSPYKHYPVLYFMDAYWDMPLLYAIHGQLVWDNAIPEMIMVGFSYPGDNPNYNDLRERDLTPTKLSNTNSNSGDGPKFLEFIESIVVPKIETDYRADKNERALAGTSLGGLFTLYAMYEKPDLFKRFIAISPAVDFDKRYLFKLDSAFVENNKSLPVRLFLSQGGVEYGPFRQPIVEFQEKINKRDYKDFFLLNYTIEGERHSGVKSDGYSRGLRWIFKDIAPAGPGGLERAMH